MKLYIPNPELSAKLNYFSRKYYLNLFPIKAPEKIYGQIIIGNGYPDDLAICIISHYLNGEVTTSVVKPSGYTGTSVFKFISTYFFHNRALKALLFLIDQETYKIDSIVDELENGLKKQRIEITQGKVEIEGRLRNYNCFIDEREFQLFLVINGLNEISTEKHRIEDHFLKAATALGIEVLPEGNCDTKAWWRKSLDENKRETILKELKNKKRTLEGAFPQQIKGCEYLKSIII